MIVVGADTHKDTHTAVAVDGATGQVLDELTAPARKRGHLAHLDWARGLAEGQELVWAIEDCRHVSGGLERFLLEAGERVHRVPPKLMGASRKGSRTRGKSDPIDATNVARAALQEGPENLPGAFLDEEAMQIKLLADHREDLVRSRAQDQQRLRWHLHEIDPDYEIPAAALDRIVWIERLGRRLARGEQNTRIEIARELLSSIRASVKRTSELEREITKLVEAKAPTLLQIPGCGALTAAKILSETSGAKLSSDAKLARLAGVAPIPASSGRRDRHRLDHGGNRQLNCALHRIAVTQGRVDERAKAFLEKKQAEGKSRMESLRSLKRHLARRVWQALRVDAASDPLLSDSPKLRPAEVPALT